MLKKGFLSILLSVFTLMAISSCTSTNSDTIGHNYFPELPEFTFWLTEDPYNYNRLPETPLSSPIEVKYLEKRIIDDKKDAYTQVMGYVFTTIPNEIQLYLLIPSGVHDTINLIPGEVYQIDYRIQYGWPNLYRLIINKEETVIFAGLADWDVDGRLNMNDMTPIQVHKSRVLEDNYIDGESDDFWERKTNNEIEFTLNENSVILHQGESSSLVDYEVTLLIAREIQYKPNWFDYQQNSFSFVISKTN